MRPVRPLLPKKKAAKQQKALQSQQQESASRVTAHVMANAHEALDLAAALRARFGAGAVQVFGGADEGALVRRGGRAAVRSLSALDRHVLPACDAGNQPSKISKFAKPALENLDPQPKEKSPGYAKPAANVHAIKELPGASRT